MCPKECSQLYYTMSLDNKYYLTKTDSRIRISFKLSQDFLYVSESRISFVLYLSNIGGLIGLWFGLSFIDIASVIKGLFKKIKLIIMKMIYLKHIIYYIKIKYVVKLTILIKYFERFNWRKFLLFLSLPVFLYQMLTHINTYLAFETEITVEIKSYFNSENNIRYETIPAITICVDNIFEYLIQGNRSDIRFYYNKTEQLRHNLYESGIHNVSYKLYNYSLNDAKLKMNLESSLLNYNENWFNYLQQIYRNSKEISTVKDDNYKIYLFNSQNNKMTLKFKETMVNFYTSLFPLDLMFDRWNNLKSAYRKEEYQRHRNKYDIRYSKTLFGDCFTYFFDQFWVKKYLENRSLSTQYMARLWDDQNYGDRQLFNRKFNNKLQALNQKVIIHEHNTQPIYNSEAYYFTNNLLVRDSYTIIKLSKVDFNRLPWPYETNCFNYFDNSRFDCLNNCYLKLYYKYLNCVPINQSLYTFDLNDEQKYSKLNICSNNKYTNNNYTNNDILLVCSNQCLESCSDTHYSIVYEMSNSVDAAKYTGNDFKFVLRESTFITLNYSPKMTFFSLIINIANIWSLWHGISFIQLYHILVSNLKFIICMNIFKKFKGLVEILRKLNDKLKYKVKI